MINTENFITEWKKIQEKLEQINSLDKLYGNGDEFVGVDIGEGGVFYKTEVYYPGCGTDKYDFFVSWDEINEPITYFYEKYQKEIEEDKKQKERLKLESEKLQKEKDLAEFKRLQEIFKNM